MRRTCLALAALTAVVTTAYADVYKSVDAQGQVHYSDTWSPGAQLIKGERLRNSATESPPPPAPTVAPADPQSDATKSDAAKKVQADVNAARAEQCKQLKEQYAKVIRARRIYQASEDSSAPKQYMSEADADAERVRTRQAMDEACGSSG